MMNIKVFPHNVFLRLVSVILLFVIYALSDEKCFNMVYFILGR
jgi:hypothetical protein